MKKHIIVVLLILLLLTLGCSSNNDKENDTPHSNTPEPQETANADIEKYVGKYLLVAMDAGGGFEEYEEYLKTNWLEKSSYQYLQINADGTAVFYMYDKQEGITVMNSNDIYIGIYKLDPKTMILTATQDPERTITLTQKGNSLLRTGTSYDGKDYVMVYEKTNEIPE